MGKLLKPCGPQLIVDAIITIVIIIVGQRELTGKPPKPCSPEAGSFLWELGNTTLRPIELDSPCKTPRQKPM